MGVYLVITISCISDLNLRAELDMIFVRTTHTCYWFCFAVYDCTVYVYACV